MTTGWLHLPSYAHGSQIIKGLAEAATHDEIFLWLSRMSRSLYGALNCSSGLRNYLDIAPRKYQPTTADTQRSLRLGRSDAGAPADATTSDFS